MLNKLTVSINKLEREYEDENLILEDICEEETNCENMCVASLSPIATSVAPHVNVDTAKPEVIDPVKENIWSGFEKDVLSVQIPDDSSVSERNDYLTNAIKNTMSKLEVCSEAATETTAEITMNEEEYEKYSMAINRYNAAPRAEKNATLRMAKKFIAKTKSLNIGAKKKNVSTSFASAIDSTYSTFVTDSNLIDQVNKLYKIRADKNKILAAKVDACAKSLK